MHVRVDAATGRIKHVSTVPFTLPVLAGETDLDLDVTQPPHEPTWATRRWRWCRVTPTGGIEIDPALVPDAWAPVRAERDRRLLVSDWTQAVRDAPLTAAQKNAWAEYRQALRDIPQTFPTPQAVIWPTPPGP